MKKEIGGYFELDQLISNEYYKELIPLNSARNALLYILGSRKIKKIYIPYYLCNSIGNMLKENNCEFDYYSIDRNFMPLFSESLSNNEYLYIVNYYGQIENSTIKNLKIKLRNVILDNTHSFFQEPLAEVDTIYSCRKFFGVPDGAYLSTNISSEEKLDRDISMKRMGHILGRYEGKASEYYDEFKINDKCLDKEKLKYMSKLTQNILGAIDYEEVIKKRVANYNYLANKLSHFNKLNLIEPKVAFTYPIYIKNGTEIRAKLAQKNIYIPTLWANVLKDMNENTIEYDYAVNILPLPCDQRYEIEDMERIINELKHFKTRR